MTLLGSILGVILNIIFPNWLVLLPLSILLAVVAYLTIVKGEACSSQMRVLRANDESLSPVAF